MWPSIEGALTQSRFLILVASPESAASPWVNKEIAYWLDRKSIDTLLIALTDGELVWSRAAGDFDWHTDTPLPRVLAGCFKFEPKWVDLRAHRDDANPGNARFIEHVANFAATIRGMPKEDLFSLEVLQQRRALTLAWSAAGTLAVLIAVASWQWWKAESAKETTALQRDIAVRNFTVAKRAADVVVFGAVKAVGNLQGMQVETMRQILHTSQSMLDALAQAAPDDLELQNSRASMLADFAVIYARAGDTTRARSAAEESLKIMRKLVVAEPSNVEWLHGVGTSLNKIGDTRQAAGDTAGALAAYLEWLATMRQLIALNPDNARWKLDLSMSLNNVGGGHIATGKRVEALAAYEESLSVIRELAASDPENKEWQSSLSLSLSGLGDVRMIVGDSRAALAAYEEGLTVGRKLTDDGVSRRLNVSALLVRIGAVHLAQSDWSAALEAYTESLTIMRILSAADPSNAARQYDLSITLEHLGDARRGAADHIGAIAAFDESLAIRRKLAAANPGNADALRGVSLSLNRIGDMQQTTGDRTAALKASEESLAIIRKLVATNPDNTQWQSDLVVSLSKVGAISDPPQANAALREALTIVETLERDGKLTAAQQTWPRLFRDAVAKIPQNTDERATPSWSTSVRKTLPAR
jgi:tetratricopeptide (TPR) repeat protein